MQPVVPELSRRREPKLGMTARATPIVSSASTVTVASRSRQSRTSRSSRKWLMGTSSEAIASSEPASLRERPSGERRDPVAACHAQAAPLEQPVELVDGDSAVGDDAGLHIGAAVELLRNDVDVGEAGPPRRSAGRVRTGTHPVEAPTDHEDGIGAAEGGGAGGVHEHGVVVGNRASAHGRRDEGDAAVDEPLEGQAGLRPARTLPHDDQGALRLRKHVGDGCEGGGIGVGPRDLRFAGAPEDGVLVEGGADELGGKSR